MNEEIEKQIDQKVDDIFMDNDGCYWGVDYDRVSSIKETMYELYLLGAKDIVEILCKNCKVPKLGVNQRWTGKPVKDISEEQIKKLAQQFIESLEGKG